MRLSEGISAVCRTTATEIPKPGYRRRQLSTVAMESPISPTFELHKISPNHIYSGIF